MPSVFYSLGLIINVATVSNNHFLQVLSRNTPTKESNCPCRYFFLVQVHKINYLLLSSPMINTFYSNTDMTVNQTIIISIPIFVECILLTQRAFKYQCNK